MIDGINSLDLNAYEVRILSLSEYNSENSIFKICRQPENVRITYLNFEFHQDYSLFGYLKILFRTKNSYSILDKLRSEIRNFNPRIIHFHTGPRELHLKKFFNHKAAYVFTDHTLRVSKQDIGTFRAWILSRIFRKLYSGFHVISVSQQIQINLIEFSIPDASRKIIFLPNSLDAERFERKSGLNFSDGLKAVYLSRIEDNKGHADLIRAWSQLKDIADKKLFIVGPDHLHGAMQKLAIDLNCFESIEFTGSVADPKVILEVCNLGIFPSWKEGLPISLLEKMAMELPVIISDIPELTNIITADQNGMIFKRGNASDLAAKIRHLYKHFEKARELGRFARKTVLKDYNAERSRETLDLFYQLLVDEKTISKIDIGN